jgi:hypothetical protein
MIVNKKVKRIQVNTPSRKKCNKMKVKIKVRRTQVNYSNNLSKKYRIILNLKVSYTKSRNFRANQVKIDDCMFR